MSAWTVIEHKKVTNNPSEITFSSIPQTYTDLILLVSGRADPNEANGGVALQIGFNGSYANISSRWLTGLGSGSAQTSSDTFIYAMTSSNDFTATTFGNSMIYIPNYTSTTTAKRVSCDGISENNATMSRQLIMSAVWNPSTQAAITSLSLKTFTSTGNKILPNSSFTLYGITKGTSGGVTVS